MAGRYDIEDYIDDLIAGFKTILNDKITKINNDKGDSLLSTLDNVAYYYKKDNPTNKASSPFVYYEPYEAVAFDDNQRLKGLGFNAKTYIFELGIAFRNNVRGADDNLKDNKRVMRYQKALEEAVIEYNRCKSRGYGHLTIQTIQSSNEARNEATLHLSAFNVSITLGG